MSGACCRSPSRPTTRKSGLFYVYYTDKKHGDIVVAEFRRSPNNPRKALPKSRRTVIRIKHRRAHRTTTAGRSSSGPTATSTSPPATAAAAAIPAENAQNLDVLLGKLIRIDPRRKTAVPTRSRPRTRSSGAPGRDEIYCLRAPQPLPLLLRPRGRPSDDRRRRPGQVGGDRLPDTRAPPGARTSAGTPTRASASSTAPTPARRRRGRVTPPIAQFSHADGNCAITGGYVYRGPKIPALDGPLRLRRLLPRADPQPAARRGGRDGRPAARAARRSAASRASARMPRATSTSPTSTAAGSTRSSPWEPVASRAGRIRRRALHPRAGRRRV